MTDYISREMTIDAICRLCNANFEEDPCEPSECEMMSLLRCIPAADVRPVVKAEWYGEADGYADGELVYDMWSCPICGKRFEEWEEKPDWNFCPNCGADMREES